MSKPREITIDQDLFLPQIATLPLRDQRDTMERPFFSLHKRKRTKPIDYVSPDGKVSVHVTGNPEYGIATIYDLDVLIYCASMLVEYKRRGVNDIPQTLAVVPYDMLKVLRRDTGGGEYQNLANALARLQSTTVRTNLHSVGRRETTFSWLDSFTQVIDAKGRIRGMRITLAKWFYDSVLMDGACWPSTPIISTSRAASRAGSTASRASTPGAMAPRASPSRCPRCMKNRARIPYRRFKFEIQKLARENVLPGYGLEVIPHEGREPSLRMTRRAQPVPAEEAAPAPFPAPAPSGRRKPAASPPPPGPPPPGRIGWPSPIPAISATPPSGHSRGPTCRTPSAIWALSGPTSGTSSPSARSRPMRSTSNRSSPPSAPARPPRVEKAAHSAFLKPRVQSRVAPNRMLFVFLKPRAIEHRQSPAMAARQQRMSGAASLRKTHQPVPNAPEIGQSHPRKPPISHTSAPGLPARTNRAAQPSRPPCPLPLLAEGHRTERAKSRIRVFRNAGTGFQERRSRGFRNGLSGFGEHRTRANRRISAESRCLSTRANSLIRT
jgi:hypothetical protein